MLDNPLKEEAFKLKGRLFTLTVLELTPCKLQTFEESVERIYQKAPNMFSNTPIVLDLKLLKGASFDLRGVMDVLLKFKMIPIAVQHASVIQQKSANACGLAVLLSRDGNEVEPIEKALANAESGSVVSNSIHHRNTASSPIETDLPEVTEPQVMERAEPQREAQPFRASKVITQPVRSGQQVYAQNADLIVLASVSTGSELLADGNIHVYGALRGRALAGIKGDTNARIFCSSLQAELVSIAGQYLMPEEKGYASQGAKQILIDEGHLKIIDL